MKQKEMKVNIMDAIICQTTSLCVNIGVEIPHDEGNPETPDYQFVKWMTRNKVLCPLAVLKHYFCAT